ncbi:MAG: hypothetical protein ACSHXK_00665 [Oceanococcus sp.]
MSTLRLLSQFSLNLPASEAAQDLKPLLLENTGRAGPRRVNRWIQLALLGARQCVGEHELPQDTAIYLTTRNGAVGDTLALLTGNAQNQPPAPFRFINVSGNMAAYYLAADLGVSGANQVIVSHELTWFSLLELAQISNAPCLLLGAVEELVWPLDVHKQRLKLPADARVGESSHWALVDFQQPGAQIQHMQRCINDDSARRLLSTEHQQHRVSVLDDASEQALGFACTVLPKSRTANALTDAEQSLNWFSSLNGTEWLALRGSTGQWGLIQACS